MAQVRQEAGGRQASALVLIGRHLDEEALRREWAECIARVTCIPLHVQRAPRKNLLTLVHPLADLCCRAKSV